MFGYAIPFSLRKDCPAFLVSTKCLNIPATNVMQTTSRLKKPKSAEILLDYCPCIAEIKLEKNINSTNLLGGKRALLHLHSQTDTS